MSDIVDRANDLVESFTQQSLEEHREATKQKYPYVKGEKDFECRECGVIIPVARRELTGSEFCIDCKNDMDDSGARGC